MMVKNDRMAQEYPEKLLVKHLCAVVCKYFSD